jgi:hypothetical protein
MAFGVGESPERSPSAILSEVEYPITRDELTVAAAESGAPIEAINFLHALPDRIYQSPTDVMREFGEGSARFGLFAIRDIRHRGDLGKEATEAGGRHHP